MTITISPESPAGSDAQTLLRALDEHLFSLYEPKYRHILDREALLSPDVTFVVARRDDEAIGCGAILRHGRQYVELKRMYVDPKARGKGVGTAIVEALERIAHDEGYRVARLETGVRQTEAIALYERAGYRRRGPFGDYPAENGVNLYYEHSLVDAG